MAQYDLADKNSLLNQVAEEGIKEYNLEYTINFFRWSNLYSETTGKIDINLVNKIIDRLHAFLNSDVYFTYTQFQHHYPTKKIDELFEKS